MSLELVRIERNAGLKKAAEPLRDKALRLVKERPYLAVAAVPLAVAKAGPVIATSVAAAAAGVVAGGEWRFRRRPLDGVATISKSELKFYRAVGGDHLREGVVYARHPKVGRRDLLIPAKQFHRHVVNEQIADLVTYLRSTVRITSLKIYIRSESGFTVRADGSLKGIPLTSRLMGGKVEETAFEQTFERPARMTSLDAARYVWLADFPHIQAAAQNARHGTMRFGQTFDYSFGLDIGVAKAAGIRTDWLSTYTFEIHAAFA